MIAELHYMQIRLRNFLLYTIPNYSSTRNPLSLGESFKEIICKIFPTRHSIFKSSQKRHASLNSVVLHPQSFVILKNCPTISRVSQARTFPLTVFPNQDKKLLYPAWLYGELIFYQSQSKEHNPVYSNHGAQSPPR